MTTERLALERDRELELLVDDLSVEDMRTLHRILGEKIKSHRPVEVYDDFDNKVNP